MPRPNMMTTNRKLLRPARARLHVAVLQRDSLQPGLLASKLPAQPEKPRPDA